MGHTISEWRKEVENALNYKYYNTGDDIKIVEMAVRLKVAEMESEK